MEGTMKSELRWTGSLTMPFAPLDRRYAERASLQIKVMYTSETGHRPVKADGFLINLSKTGCKVLANMLPPAGTSITLFLYVPDGGLPLCLTGTTVAWVAGHTFAARFPKLTEGERKRLQLLIWKHVTFMKPKQTRTAFRLA